MGSIRQSTAGLTRLELLLGLGSLALITTLSLLVFGKSTDERQNKEAAVAAKRLAGAVSEWKKDHDERGCPSVSQLLRDNSWSSRERADDPWGSRFRISCSEARVRVKSAGGDGRFETEDDISVESDWNS